ncbi:PAS domain-containing sensor histidine kinase [bacterium]|nr:PAS domain-containing sensor histidine kinase [bacterium]
MKKTGRSRVRLSASFVLNALILAVFATFFLWIWQSLGLSQLLAAASSSIGLVSVIGWVDPADLVGWAVQVVVMSFGLYFILQGQRWAMESKRDRSPDDERIIQLFASAIHSTSDGMALTTKDGTFIWANEGMSKLTGYPVGEIIGSDPSLFKSGRQSPQVYKKLWSTVLAGMRYRGEFVNKRKDGSLYTGEINITPILNQHGEVTHFSVIERDITKRVETEESLRQGKERFRMLVESMNDGMVLLDNHEYIEYANPTLMSKLGYKADELVNLNFLDLLDDANRQLVHNQFEARQAGSRQSYDLNILNRSGLKKKFRVSPHGLFDKSAKLVGSIAVLRDITLEQETESRLVAAKEQAESTNKFQTSMLDNISHEFRTPLAGIIGFTELLEETVEEDQLEMVSHIKRSSQRLLRTLNGIISMSALLSDQLETEVQPCNVDTEIADLASDWSAVAKNKNVTLTTQSGLQDTLPKINKDQFRIIAESLIENAVKFTDVGEIRIITRVKDDSCFEFVVQDTGIGIEADAQKVIFEPFTQESSGITRTHTGMGLGLSVVGLLVAKMGGSIGLTSLKNVGSEFVVTLPLKSPFDILLGEEVQVETERQESKRPPRARAAFNSKAFSDLSQAV